MPCSRSCCGADTFNLTQPPALPPTGCTDLPIRACPRLTRQIDLLRYGRVSGGRTEAVVGGGGSGEQTEKRTEERSVGGGGGGVGSESHGRNLPGVAQIER